jgi:hypothetical protein
LTARRPSLTLCDLETSFLNAGGTTFRIKTFSDGTRRYWLIQRRPANSSTTFAGGDTSVACAGLENTNPFASSWFQTDYNVTNKNAYGLRALLRRQARAGVCFETTLANLRPFLDYVGADSPALRYCWFRIVDLWGSPKEGEVAAALADKLFPPER